jgi:hypothetical protein
MARHSGSEVLNLILVLTNCQVMVAIFLVLAVAAELTELPTTEGKTAEKVAKMVWLLKLLHCDWIWLRIHKLWLPEVLVKLVWH